MSQETLAGGRYVLDRIVGAGGMADVYRARDTRLGRDVAVKLFRPGSAEGVERGSGEARMLAGLHHPGLVRVLDMDTEAAIVGPTYLVMEYVKGPDLGALLREGPLSPGEVHTIGWDLARTLDYIHGRGIVHRDIKPSNMLTRCGEATDGMFSYLLTDFGIARFFESSRLTATGSLIGTATYFSPEQARGETVGAPTDIYALGLVLIECLSGKPAYPGSGLESALARLSRQPSVPETAGPAWQALITAMTNERPQDRPTAGEVDRALSAMDREPAGQTQVLQQQAALTTVIVSGGASNQEQSTQLADRPRIAVPSAPFTEPGFSPTQPSPSVEQATSSAWSDSGRSWDLKPVATPRPRLFPDDIPNDGARAGKRRYRTLIFAALALLLLAVAAVVIVGLISGAWSEPEPLPAVPGTTGELLDRLYESVRP
ncbi:serine/threonine-protein kinase [Arthrobacter sp. H5]|uniref:serine/threonine-protein kinase n=1 Tax=Arthrobacter sp. H5 TaxID=1267973 RepID=UPI0004B91C31|nr:serine/threonine-protein kinase [Arthrobacter sp. H5]